MRCKNPHCKGIVFNAVIEMGTQRVIGLICSSCGSRYSLDEDIEIKKSLKREGWNSVKWYLKY